ncbi:hypothetical protein NW759_010724 [Fusarium solani]|nr:hypothetical protein NW759_010724 [Fusarium solani]
MTSASDLPPEVLAYVEGARVVGVCAAMIPVATVIVAVRFWSRWRKRINIGIDDWLILISLPLLWSVAILGICAVHYGGVRRHLAVVLMEDQDIFGRSMLCLFIGEFTYGAVLCTIKAAIFLMYYRIFPIRFMKFGGYVLGGMTFAWWIAVIFVSIFQCVPVQKTWHPFMEGGALLG